MAPRSLWARLRGLVGPRPHGYQSQLDALVTEEGRRGARVVLPFLLPTLYIVRVILGDAMEQPGVQTLMLVQLGLIVVRWGVLFAMSRPSLSPGTDGSRTQRRVRSIAFTVSAWSISACFGAIYFAAAPALDNAVILKLAMVATAVSAVATLSMSAALWSYFGYIAIHLGAIIVLMVQSPDPKLTLKMPLMVVALIVALGVIAARTNAALREKIMLGIELRDSALRDGLTGLRNRNFVTEFVSQMSVRVLGDWESVVGRRRVADRRSLALFLVDLDHFKSINDKHGHAGGDRVLKAFAEIAQSTLRAPDIVARWGGEEFLVIVEMPDREAVRAIGERIRRSVAAHRAIEPGGATLSVTCSIGACLFPFDEEHPGDLTWEETLELADRALYEAKRTGRNRALWICRGAAGIPPREALTAARVSLDGAVRDRAIELVPKDANEGRASGGPVAIPSVPRLALS